MTRWSTSLLERALMVVVSAFLFVEFFRLNEYLFAALQHTQSINWVFLPAGFRVLLVLVLGLHGALGIALGSLWLNLERFEQSSLVFSTLVCLASGLAPWLVKFAMEKSELLDRQLMNINSARLLQYVLVYAGVNALAHQAIFWGFAVQDTQPWIDVWPMFVGDTLGALIVLYTFKLSLPWLRGLLRPKA